MNTFSKTQLALALAFAASVTAGCNSNPERASTNEQQEAEVVSVDTSADIERNNEYSMQEDYPSLDANENRYSQNQTRQTESISDTNTILFEFDSADLTDDAKESLDQLVNALEGQNDAVESITIRGYADAMGPEEYNEQLSQSRANSVRNYLRDQGINADSWRVEGMGEENPVASNDDAQGRSENRRVVIELSGDNVRGLSTSYSPD